MARPEKPVDAAGGVAATFARELRQLRARAGNPTYRDMARSAMHSPSVLSSAASGTRLPTLQVTLGFVAACGGDREQWRRRWMEAMNATDADAPKPGRYSGSLADDGISRPAQLPPRPAGFVGRRAELNQFSALVAAPVVITGPVGVGKSAFALRVAHHIAADLADGQLYADLGTSTGTKADAGYVLDGFLPALGVAPDQLPGTVDQRAGLYRSILAERKLLVVLDNVHDERQVRPLLSGSGHSTTLVSSRKPLLGLDGVRRINLHALPRADSIAMITAAVPERADAQPQECDRLAGLCDDLPLALDIALRRLAARPDLPLRAVSAKLARGDSALDWLCVGDLSLRESLDSAYQEVSDVAKILLGRIARLRFRFDLDSVMHNGCEAAEELTEAGLLHRGDRPGTYRVERLVRAFASQMPAPPDDHALRSLRVEVPRQWSRLGTPLPNHTAAEPARRTRGRAPRSQPATPDSAARPVTVISAPASGDV